jgi:hypothetical protein
MNTQFEALTKKYEEKRARAVAKRERMIQNGINPLNAPKGIQTWYDTRTLINLVEKRMDSIEATFGKRYCPINGKWQLQIRGKHIRRLLKAKPQWKQVGRRIVEEV